MLSNSVADPMCYTPTASTVGPKQVSFDSKSPHPTSLNGQAATNNNKRQQPKNQQSLGKLNFPNLIAKPISLNTLDRDCFIIPVTSLDRFLPAGVTVHIWLVLF
jgi:hypothetical protein